MEVTSEEDNFKAVNSQLANATNLVGDYGRDVDKVSELHNRILSAPMANSSAEQELSEFMGKIRLENDLIRDELISIDTFLKTQDDTTSIPEPLARLKQEYESLRRSFSQLISNYTSNQTRFRDECKMGLQRHLSASETKFSEEEVEEMIEAGNFSKCISNEAELHEHHNQYMAEAEARHKSLTGVQASLEELKEIMTHFNKIFGCHGESVDKAEYQVLEGTHKIEDTQETLSSLGCHK